MKKIATLPFIIFCILICNFSFAQDGTTSKKKSTTTSVATKKADENKKAPVATAEPKELNAPVYTPRPATSPEPQKKLPKKNPVAGPR